MGHIFLTAANAVLPIVLLILVGVWLRKKGLLTEGFLTTGNKLVFVLCLPVSLFVSVYNIENIHDLRWDVIGYCVVMILVIFLLGLITALVTTRENSRRGVLLQCAFRSNFAIIGQPLAAALGGSEAQAVSALVLAVLVPMFNILAVIALSSFDDRQQHHSVRAVLRDIVKNPLIIGTALALLCLGVRYWQEEHLGYVAFSIKGQLPFLYTALNYLKGAVTPLALIVMGGQFRFSAARGILKEIAVGTLWRTVLAPVVGVGTAILLSRYTGLISFGVNEYPALVALFGSPVAVSSAIMAKQMGGDSQLATQYVVWTSLVSVVTVFLLVSALMSMGLLAGV